MAWHSPEAHGVGHLRRRKVEPLSQGRPDGGGGGGSRDEGQLRSNTAGQREGLLPALLLLLLRACTKLAPLPAGHR